MLLHIKALFACRWDQNIAWVVENRIIFERPIRGP